MRRSFRVWEICTTDSTIMYGLTKWTSQISARRDARHLTPLSWWIGSTLPWRCRQRSLCSAVATSNVGRSGTMSYSTWGRSSRQMTFRTQELHTPLDRPGRPATEIFTWGSLLEETSLSLAQSVCTLSRCLIVTSTRSRRSESAANFKSRWCSNHESMKPLAFSTLKCSWPIGAISMVSFQSGSSTWHPNQCPKAGLKPTNSGAWPGCKKPVTFPKCTQRPLTQPTLFEHKFKIISR